MIQLPSHTCVEGIIIGILLSDAWITFASKTNKNAKLGFKQSLAHFEYFTAKGGLFLFFYLLIVLLILI